MSDRHATTADLPNWNTPETILGLAGHRDRWGWIRLSSVNQLKGFPQRIGYDMDDRLWVSTAGSFEARATKGMIDGGSLALLVGVDDGISLWLPESAYQHVKRVSPTADVAQPDVPPWHPVREILPAIPDDAQRRMILS
ncbi:hypothetical protein ACFWGI_06710 [Streptomyces niveus]|uniref:hypothetical protein n=1 Tax=Streptomyces niveus TaxID=193462 RepID=UPI003653C613